VIDFGEDAEIEDEQLAIARADMLRVIEMGERLLKDSQRGELVTTGVHVALVGPVNAGKSSLMNLLAKRPAAIVSATAGTTRDVVQVNLDVAGVPVVLSDTAGLRGDVVEQDSVHVDDVEREGMRRALDVAATASVIIVVIDAADPNLLQTAETTVAALSRSTPLSEQRQVLVLFNKSDTLSSETTFSAPSVGGVHCSDVILGSVNEGQGM